ncbi:MAG: xanthine dehydrogenase family protein molybdopterin-binding subunit, partial [Actinomycetota bacterium]
MTTIEERPVAEVGSPRKRSEDAHLITGQTQWTDNITLPGMLHLAVLRSPVAHGRISRVDVTAARERPGVVAAFSGADLADEWASGLPTAWTVSEDLKTPPHLPLATDKVRYVGDGIAVVAATSREAAADALESISFDLEPLPPVLDMEGALADGAPLVHEDVPNNRAFTYTEHHGDYTAARRRADVVVSRRFINQRLIPSAIEPRSIVAEPHPATGEYTLWSS